MTSAQVFPPLQTTVSPAVGLRLRLRLWTLAIREGFVALLPLTLIGAIANMLAYMPVAGYAQWMQAQFGSNWTLAMNLTLSATMGIMGLASAMVIAMRLTTMLTERATRTDASLASISAVAAAAFLLVVLPHDGSGNLMALLGYASILEGLVVGIVTAEMMFWANRWLPRHEGLNALESGVPLQHALRLSEQAALALLAIHGLHELMNGLSPLLHEWVYQPLITALNQSAPGPALLNLLLVVANQLLWLVGINGGQLLLHLGANGTPHLADPSVVFSSTQATPAFVNAFAHLGGAGATWGLILACLIWGRDAGLRKLAWFSVLPAVLNVNELLLFGIPLVFGRTLLLPFVLAPAVNALLSVMAVQALGLPMQGQSVVWSMPIFASGWIMTGTAWGAALQLLSLVCSTAIYLPFVRRLEGQRERRSQKALSAALDVLVTPVLVAPSLLERPDHLGDIARGLMEDFRRDLGTERVYLAYQPQHDAAGHMVGVEALLRWRHPLHGAIPTAAIINIAEECALIHQIGEWVVNRACADLAAWRKAGMRGFAVSINMSPLQLEDPRWVDTVRKALAIHGIQPHLLDLEITEGRMMASSQVADAQLAKMEAMQLKLSMDDFGMGCSSLLYMQRFRMYSIKLDGQLTRDVLTNPVNQDIIRAVCRLGSSQGVKVVAEFVETAPQRRMLEELGCDLFQGWLYSAAMPEAELRRYAQRHAPSRDEDLPHGG